MRPIAPSTLLIKRSVAILPGAICKFRKSSRAASPKQNKTAALPSFSEAAAGGPSRSVEEDNGSLKFAITAFVDAGKFTGIGFLGTMVSHAYFYFRYSCYAVT